MEKRVICELPDNSVTIIVPSQNALKKGWTLEQIIAKDAPKDTISTKTVDVVEIPSDRTYRPAWIKGANGKAIDHDMVKCREHHRNIMRRFRQPLLEAEDVEYMRAIEANDTVKQSACAAKKQQLRDVTIDPSIDAAATPEDLKLAWPAILGTNPLT